MPHKQFTVQARLSQQRISNWMFITGLILGLLGLLAVISSFIATMATILVFGALLLVAGVVQAANALAERNGQYKFRLFGAALYLAVGLIMLLNPVDGAIGLTLLIVIFFLATGVMRLTVAFFTYRLGMAPGWHIGGGALSLMLAVLILVGWPETGTWVIGFFLGLELLFAGATLTFFSSGIRKP